MADIRINALANTASSTASDDYLAVDGTTNGTRKLNAYSPTFGGNLTVSGTGTGDTIPYNILAGGNKRIYIGYNTTGDYGAVAVADTGVAWKNLVFNQNGGNVLIGQTSDSGQKLQVNGTALISGNLTVSGTGTSSVAGNLGVGGGTTLTSFDTAYSASQVTGSLSLLGDNVAAIYGNNIYYNAGWKYSKASYVGLYVQNNAGLGDHAWYTAGSGSVGGSVSLTQALTLKNGGNVLIGTTTDAGYKLRVNGSIASDDVITMLKSGGNSTSVDGNFGQVIARTNTGNIGFACALANNGDYGGFTIATPSQSRSVAFLGSNGTAYIQTNNGTTALTLDSSQRTILSGALRLANSYVATPQISTGYVTIQDSTGTTYKVLVAP